MSDAVIVDAVDLEKSARSEWAAMARSVRDARGQQKLPWLPDDTETEYRELAMKSATCWMDLVVRALSMGKLHHAMMGTAAVAIAAAAAVEGTLVHQAAGGGVRETVCFGHPSGTLRVGAQAKLVDGTWIVTRAIMSRSARILMRGWVHVPFAA